MQLRKRQGKIAKKRSRHCKKAHRSMSSLKWTYNRRHLRKDANRRSRREARELKVQNENSATQLRLEMTDNKSSMQYSFRQRLNFCVFDTSGVQVPNCPHGPCLLFGRSSTSGEIIERFFGCAVYRSERCNFIYVLGDSTNGTPSSSQQTHIKQTKVQYGRIRKSVNRLVASGVELHYCGVCNDAVSLPHRDPVVGPLRRVAFRRPTHLISAVVDDNGEAQYWFASESVSVIANALITNRCDGVLCIGAPTLFEHFRCSAQRRMSMKSFLLDFDCRFASFYQSSQFAQFSMLTNYFYDPASVQKFDAFLMSVNHLAIVCDPPFGVIVRPLFTTIDELRRKFKKLHQGDLCEVNLLVILPIFVAKHVKHCDEQMEMVDYKVCYRNHPKYAKREKSVVRIFTDFPLNKFVLPSQCGYRFCEMCERYVSIENRHCGLCGICPSKDGSPYHHCDHCNRCVKNTYRHCEKCTRCHLKGRCLKDGNPSYGE
uniref:CTCHY-type domain-containing protein n=1 Tax=Parascaris univalens TaxID=6257 RepID=A0A915BHB5_PARUN